MVLCRVVGYTFFCSGCLFLLAGCVLLIVHGVNAILIGMAFLLSSTFQWAAGWAAIKLFPKLLLDEMSRVQIEPVNEDRLNFLFWKTDAPCTKTNRGTDKSGSVAKLTV